MSEEEKTPRPEGWKFLWNAPRKCHYFRNGESLCKRWMTFADGDLQPDEGTSADDCKGCRKALDKEKVRA